MTGAAGVAGARSRARSDREARRRGVSYDTSTAVNRTKLRARVERGAGREHKLRAAADGGDQQAADELDRYERSKAALEEYEQEQQEKAALEELT